MPALLGCEGRKAVGYDRPEFADGFGCSLSQEGHELREGHLDRVGVRRVWRQE